MDAGDGPRSHVICQVTEHHPVCQSCSQVARQRHLQTSLDVLDRDGHVNGSIDLLQLNFLHQNPLIGTSEATRLKAVKIVPVIHYYSCRSCSRCVFSPQVRTFRSCSTSSASSLARGGAAGASFWLWGASPDNAQESSSNTRRPRGQHGSSPGDRSPFLFSSF